MTVVVSRQNPQSSAERQTSRPFVPIEAWTDVPGSCLGRDVLGHGNVTKQGEITFSPLLCQDARLPSALHGCCWHHVVILAATTLFF